MPTYFSRVAVLRDESVRLRMGIFLMIGILLTLAVYIAFANGLASKNFTLKSYGEKLKAAKREQAHLEIEIASKKSLEVLKANGEALGLVPIKNPEYIEAVSPVARK